METELNTLKRENDDVRKTLQLAEDEKIALENKLRSAVLEKDEIVRQMENSSKRYEEKLRSLKSESDIQLGQAKNALSETEAAHAEQIRGLQADIEILQLENQRLIAASAEKQRDFDRQTVKN